jgi:hypothetical protein
MDSILSELNDSGKAGGEPQADDTAALRQAWVNERGTSCCQRLCLSVRRPADHRCSKSTRGSVVRAQTCSPST